MMVLYNRRLRILVFVGGIACSLLLFSSSLRCSVFSISCLEEKAPKFPGTTGHLQGFLPQTSLFNRSLQRTKSLSFFTVSRDPLTDLGDLRNNSSLKNMTYEEALHLRADKNGVIILVSTDYGYIHMALNLYFTSFQRFNITNYLYVCSDNQAASVLQANGIAYVMMAQDKDGKTESAYGTVAFSRKTHIKTHIIHDALMYGFTVLIVDVDIVFFKPPLPFLSCTDCDMQIQSDGNEGNTGFYLARPTKAAILLHANALATAARSPSLSNQKAVDRTMERMIRRGAINVRTLSTSQFPHGNAYFELGHRMFAGENPCKVCVIVHNNWIVSGAAKEYRFKEHLMWMDNSDDYYSSLSAKYLLYDNPYDFGRQSTGLELAALRSAMAIGHLLNRIVILPSFHCYGCRYQACQAPRCSLNTHLRISTFNKFFSGAYREHVFLKHPYVPTKVKESLSDLILIKTEQVAGRLRKDDLAAVKHLFVPANPALGATSSEVLKWFEPFAEHKVLRFHSLYSGFGKFDGKNPVNPSIDQALKEGFQKADYRQY